MRAYALRGRRIAQRLIAADLGRFDWGGDRRLRHEADAVIAWPSAVPHAVAREADTLAPSVDPDAISGHRLVFVGTMADGIPNGSLTSWTPA
jgi:hypothetical protein